MLRHLAAVALLLILAGSLSGCMAALQVGEATSVTPFAPPAPSPTQVAPAATTQASATPEEQTPADAASPTALAEPAAAPTATPAFVAPTLQAQLPTLALPTLTPVSNEQRWRARQESREVFPALESYRTTGSELYWFDPINQQSVAIGLISGEFSAQARFILRGPGVEALEVPYQVNQSYGLTALSPAILDRIRAAGYSDWIETYVVLAPGVNQR